MSEPSTPESDRAFRVVLPIAIGLLVAAAWVSDRGRIRHDLQIVAPNYAAPGDPLPIRAFLFERTEGAPAPRALDQAVVRLVPLGSDRETVARGELRHAEVLGLEGSLVLPESLASGDYRLLGVARVDDRELLVSRRVHVQTPALVMERRGRLQTDPQRYELAPLRRWTSRDDEAMGLAIEPAPEHEPEPDHEPEPAGDHEPEPEGDHDALFALVRLEARVVGGDCSPPVPCELLVDVGPAAVELRLREGTTWIDGGPECDGTTARFGIVRCVVEGNANARIVDLVALDDGRPFARRRLQLPLGTAAPAITSAPTLVALGSTPSIAIRGPLDEETVFVVDVFHDERWLHTESVRATPGAPIPLSRPLDRPGLWRLQARLDPFGADHAATRYVFVGSLAELIESGYPEAWGVDDARELSASDPERTARFILAAGELELVTMPGLTRGAQQAEAGLHETQGIRRWGAAALVMLAGILVAVAIVRRGLRADVEATRLLESVGETPAPRSRAPIFGAGAFTILLFAAVAMMVLSRGCL